MTKDLGLAQDAATRAQAATPLGSLAHQVHHVLFSEFCGNFILIFPDLPSDV